MRVKIILVLSIFSEDLGQARGWVTTRESAACVKEAKENREVISDCYHNAALFLENLIGQKLKPKNPYGKQDFSWWYQPCFK